MNRCLGRAARVAITFLVLSILVRNTGADDVSTGPKGINSQGLALTGKGITLGQLEIKRPGLPTKDTAGKSNTTVTPSAVFIAGTAVAFPAQQDIGVDSHAEGVAGIMIAKPPAPISVAPDALLFSSTATIDMVDDRLSTQRLITAGNGKIRAMNYSYGDGYNPPPPIDGNAPISQFVDWSASFHSILYVIAGNEGTGGYWPSDNYNGMTIGSSDIVGGTFLKVANRNELVTASNGRHLTAIIAPGETISMPDLGVDGAGKPAKQTKSGPVSPHHM